LFDWTPYLPTEKSPGPWLPEIRELKLCSRGYHVTADPAIWYGNVVYLCETMEPADLTDKTVHATIRLLVRIFPEDCIDPRVYVRVMFPFLGGANLEGANLRGANLYGAYRPENDIPGWVSKDGYGYLERLGELHEESA
jgi:hypothetical protein